METKELNYNLSFPTKNLLNVKNLDYLLIIVIVNMVIVKMDYFGFVIIVRKIIIIFILNQLNVNVEE
jgi:hypothetical protein